MAEAIQPVNQVAQLTELLTLLKGKPATTSTTSSNISQEGVNALLQQILQSNQGLAAIASGQKTAGVYGSPTNQMLINDLLTRATGEVEKLKAGTTTTQKQAPALKSNQALALLALTQGAKLLDRKKTGGLDLQSIISGAWNSITGMGSTAPSVLSGSPGVLSGADALANYAMSLQLAPTLSGGLAADGIMQAGNTGGLFASTAASAVDAVGSLGAFDFSGAETTIDAVKAFNEAFSSGASTAGQAITTIGSEAVEAGKTAVEAAQTAEAAKTAGEVAKTASTTANSWGGSWLGYLGSALDAYGASQTDKDYRRAVGGAILNYFGASAATPVVDAIVRPISDRQIERGFEYGGIGGSFMAEPLGTLFSGKFDERDVFSGITDPANLFGGNPGGSVGSVAGFAADPIGASLGGKGVAGVVSNVVNKAWVICTELNKQGLLEDSLYSTSGLYALNLPEEVLAGYHYWAVPAVTYLRKYPKLAKLVSYIAIARCKHLQGQQNIIGKLTVKYGEPFCGWLGSKEFVKKAVALRSWENLYVQH